MIRESKMEDMRQMIADLKVCRESFHARGDLEREIDMSNKIALLKEEYVM